MDFPKLYSVAGTLVLAFHLAWILWVIFGALWTRGRRWLMAFHFASLVWGILVETGPWPCPLTLAESFFDLKAGVTPYQGSFLQHYLERIVYPNLPVELLTVCGVIVCVANLAVYGWRYWRWRSNREGMPPAV